jgi:NhaA family Na+:H+ antiporter
MSSATAPGEKITLRKIVLEYSVILMLGAATSFLLVNLFGLSEWYHGVVEFAHLHFVAEYIALPLFIYMVAVEIKDEIKPGGKLHGRKGLLPVFAAGGGMVFPGLAGAALAYLLKIPGFDPIGAGATSVATDIAFASLALLPVPRAVRVFVVAAAIADDIGGILVLIAVGGSHIDFVRLGIGYGATIAIALFLRVLNRTSVLENLFVFAAAWATFYFAHAEQALAFLILPWVMNEHVTKHFEELLEWPTEILMGIFGFSVAGVAFTAAGSITYGMYAVFTIFKPIGFWVGTRVGLLVMGIKRENFEISPPDLLVASFAMSVAFTVASIIAGISFTPGAVYDQVIAGALLTLLNIPLTLCLFLVTRPWARRFPATIELNPEVMD